MLGYSYGLMPRFSILHWLKKFYKVLKIIGTNMFILRKTLMRTMLEWKVLNFHQTFKSRINFNVSLIDMAFEITGLFVGRKSPGEVQDNHFH